MMISINRKKIVALSWLPGVGLLVHSVVQAFVSRMWRKAVKLAAINNLITIKQSSMVVWKLPALCETGALQPNFPSVGTLPELQSITAKILR
jgi:hypothetical protein